MVLKNSYRQEGPPLGVFGVVQARLIVGVRVRDRLIFSSPPQLSPRYEDSGALAEFVWMMTRCSLLSGVGCMTPRHTNSRPSTSVRNCGRSFRIHAACSRTFNPTGTWGTELDGARRFKTVEAANTCVPDLSRCSQSTRVRTAVVHLRPSPKSKPSMRRTLGTIDEPKQALLQRPTERRKPTGV